MTKLFAAVAALILMTLPSAASARSSTDELARCAWQKVPTTASTLLLRAKFDAQYIYNADGSPTVGPLMRVFAACHSEKTSAGKDWEIRGFLKSLRATKPSMSAPDLFDQPVYRCEIRFADSPLETEPAAVGWGFGSSMQEFQLSYRSEIGGVTLAQLDFGSLPKRGDAAIEALLRRAQSIEPMAVRSKSEGTALGRPYIVDRASGVRTCRLIGSDGNFSATD